MENNPELVVLMDKLAITEVLMCYCRGVDRMDRETLVSAYWPDATDDHVKYVGGVLGLIDFIFATVSRMRTQHMMGNVLIEMRGADRALCESYVRAYHEADGTFGTEELDIGARYLDIFEKREGKWRIRHRKVCIDYYRTSAATSDWRNGRYVAGPSRSEKSPRDPLYTFESEWERSPKA
jgi:hypothetical protein